MMKKLILAILVSTPLFISAQESLSTLSGNNRSAKVEKTVDPRYLEGAVPEINGRVNFTIDIPCGKNPQEAYKKAIEWAESTAKECISSKITYTDEANYTFVLRNEQYLVFKSRSLELDRTRIYYQVTVKIENEKCHAEMSRINYWYEENRNGGIRYTAEEWITDKNALTKKKNNLLKLSGKFRVRTIDLKDSLFSILSNSLK